MSESILASVGTCMWSHSAGEGHFFWGGGHRRCAEHIREQICIFWKVGIRRADDLSLHSGDLLLQRLPIAREGLERLQLVCGKPRLVEATDSHGLDDGLTVDVVVLDV